MNIFEYVTAILLLVLGLGITNLLTDAVNVFRARRNIEFHWMPLTWVGIIFAWQMQFLWAVFEQHVNRVMDCFEVYGFSMSCTSPVRSGFLDSAECIR